MAIKLTTTSQAAIDSGLKFLIHGPAGIGKTTLAATTGEPTLIISAESGLLALRGYDIPVIEIQTWQDLVDAYNFVLLSPDAKQFKWIALDSLTEIAEVCLGVEKAKSADPRQAYGTLRDKVFDLIRKFRDLPGRNVYFVCQQTREKEESTGAVLFVPSMPGKALGQGAPFHFDEVFSMRLVSTADGQLVRALQTNRDLQHEAKDRSGCLDMLEPANLAHIAAKIRAGIRRPINASTGAIVQAPPTPEQEQRVIDAAVEGGAS